MPDPLRYRFDDLPLVPSTSLLAHGYATVSGASWSWQIDAIELDNEWPRQAPVPLAADHLLYRIVRDALQLQCADDIGNALGQAEADARAERREEAYAAKHGTWGEAA